MKRLQLRVSDLTNARILSHLEIKNIMGGSGGSGSSGSCTITITDNTGRAIFTLNPSFEGTVTCSSQWDYCSTECMNNSGYWEDGGSCSAMCSECN
jgi:hypothetical protein